MIVLLDKMSRKILCYMIDKSDSTSFIWSFSDVLLYSCSSDIYELANDIQENVEDVRACIRYLKENGFIEYQIAKSSSGSSVVGFYLSHKGLHHSEMFRLQVKSFFMSSILTPIIVALVTSFLANFFF